MGILIFLLLLTTGGAFAQIDVMFWEDFENLQDGDTPDLFEPKGYGNPDWDNQLYNPGGATIDFNEIEAATVVGNTTKKYHLKPVDGTGEKPLLLGANFIPSSDQYVVIEYDILTEDDPDKGPAGVIVYADGYGDLDGTQPNLRVALMVQFNDFKDVDDDAGGNAGIYRTLDFGNDASAFYLDPGAPSEYMLRDDGDSNAFSWATSKWYRVQVIADQVNKTFDIKVIDKVSGSEQTTANQPFNNSIAGYVRKIWFYSGDKKGDIYIDNLLIYESTQAPPAAGPTIVFHEYSKGPVNANTGLDVDFFDDTDLQSIQYKIGTSGAWKDLTSDGTNSFNLTGGGDKKEKALVYITDADFAGMSEGENRVYFRAEDDVAQVTESAAHMSFYKDTQIPNAATVTVPNSSTISALTSIEGLVADAVSGVAANSATFALQRQDNSEYWNGAGWQVGVAALPTTHSATSDGTEVGWINAGALPPLTGVNMTAKVSIDDNLGNGIYTGTPFTFMVNPGFPEIQMNVASVGPARNNAFAPMDVDFADDTDLQAIQYKIGVAGAWTDLTSDGINPFNLTGGADTAITASVFITNADFAAMAEGESDIYFRTIDNVANTSDTLVPLFFRKDTQQPAVGTFTTPSTDPFSSLPTVAGQLSDGANGFGIDANSSIFSIQRSSDGNYWTGSGWGALTELPTTHPKTTDDSVVNWVKNDSVPTLSDLTNGVTYTFRLTTTDKAGNTVTNPVAYLFDDVPEVATVTTPANNSYTNSPAAPKGQAGDHEGGSGLNADSTTFTYQRASDGWYWNGAGWQAVVANLPTTHGATTSSNQVTWIPSGSLPGAGDLSDGAYYIQATVTNINARSLTGTSITVNYDLTPPDLSALSTSDTDGDGSIDRLVTAFTEPVDETTIVAGNFSTDIGSISGVVDDGVASDAVIWVNLTDGVLATDAVPTLTIAAGGIEDVVENPNALISAFGSTDAAGPAVLSAVASDETNLIVGIDSDDTVTVTFSESTNQPVINAGNIDVVLALSGGHSWLDGAAAIGSAVWSTPSVLVITLSDTTSDPSVAVGDTITLDGATITDGTNGSAVVASPAISGSFTPPDLSALSTSDTDGDGSIDRLVAAFTEPVDETTIAAGNFSTDIGSISSVVDDGVALDAVIWVNLTDGVLATDAVPQLTIAAGGIEGVAGNPNALITAFGSTDGAGPAVLSAVASDETNLIVGIDSDDTVSVTFSESTNQPVINAGNIDVVLALSGGHTWLDGDQ
jgi:hypothetical protein